jgi:glycosyltransferase involved in cell wall biosynthesis
VKFALPKPFYSVVIPTYNRGELLRETLQSVLRQDCDDFEVIVVDDGSTEDLSPFASEFRDRARFLRQDNAGPSAARNRGVAEANGEYVAFLDSDDVWLPWTLSIYRQAIVEHDRPGFVAGCPYLFQSSVDLANLNGGPVQTLSFPDYLRAGDAWRWFGVSSFVIRRDVLVESGGFSTAMWHGEDADLAMKLGTAPGFVQILSPFTFGYRQGSGDQLTDDWQAQLPAVLNLVAKERTLQYPGNAERAVERRRIISRHVRPVALSLMRKRKFADAWSLYLSLLSWNLRLGQWKFVFGFPAWAVWRQTLGRVIAPIA